MKQIYQVVWALVAFTIPNIIQSQTTADVGGNPHKFSDILVLPREIPPIRPGEFVTRAGSILILAGREFRFAGGNTYYLQPEVAYGNERGVREVLDSAVTLGHSVVRAHGFNDHPVPGDDPAVIQSAPGVFNEANLAALDRAVAEARARNLRIIFNLTNYWSAYGGISRYVQWKLNRLPTVAELGLFYTDETIKGWFKNYVNMLLNRSNTATGIKYKDEPAIMAWELGNELRNRGDAGALLAWQAELASYIKSIDPNHLVADGGEGMDDDASLYPGLSNTYAVRGDEGCSYRRLVDIPEIDLVSYHLYPTSWGLNDATDVEIWIRVHQQLARAAGKVAYLGEFGRRAGDDPPNCDRTTGRQFDPIRAQIFDRWLKVAVEDNGASGHMVWQSVYDARPDCDGFAVYCPEDTQSCHVLQKYSSLVMKPPLATVSAASYFGEIVATESIAAVFGVDLAPETLGATTLPLPTTLSGIRVSVKDALGIDRPAGLFFVSPTQINLHLPPETVRGGAVVSVMRDDQLAAFGTTNVTAVAPGVFSADASGTGVAAALILRIKADGAISYEPVARFDATQNRFVAVPIDLGPESDRVFLILFGTGVRHHDSPVAVSLSIGGTAAEVLYAGPQGDLVGLDQINLRMSRHLIGQGEVEIVLKVSGRMANTVKVAVK
jgi:mannan endo-1,4-beta-mannosidase